MRRTARILLPALLSLALAAPAHAELTPQAKQEVQAATQQAQAALQSGPQDIKLLDQAVLKLPAGFGFVPNPAAKRLMAAWGNVPGDDLLGLVIPTSGGQNWFLVVTYEKSGYIKDDDAKHWKVDELLDNLRQGTEENNKRRVSLGIPQMEIVGWVRQPDYDAGSHHLIWSIQAKNKDIDTERPPVVNYNTFVLGREGYISMDLVSDLAAVQGYTDSVRTLLDDLSFNAGKRYQDFDSSTDKVAEYGLAALVGGVVLKKIGLFALAAAFFIKIWKLTFLAVIGAVTAVRKFWKRKQAAVLPPPPGGNLK